jgi:hypothetical protein
LLFGGRKLEVISGKSSEFGFRIDVVEVKDGKVVRKIEPPFGFFYPQD